MTPRTYRIGAGYTLFLGGLTRIDIVTLPSATIYLTVWASDLLPLHMGKTATAEDLYKRFVGTNLYPPTASLGTGFGKNEEGPPRSTATLREMVPLRVRARAFACMHDAWFMDLPCHGCSLMRVHSCIALCACLNASHDDQGERMMNCMHTMHTVVMESVMDSNSHDAVMHWRSRGVHAGGGGGG
jgi:hypothetical protein